MRLVDADALRKWVLYWADYMNGCSNYEQAKAYNHCLVLIDEHTQNADAPSMKYAPTYEELPIDLDEEEEDEVILFPEREYKCDSCIKPQKWSCLDRTDCKEDYPFGECCADNLEDNIGKICFDNNLPSKLAKDIISIIKKERERNECLYVHREYRES